MRLVRIFLLIGILGVISGVANAQPGDPGGGGNPTVPITGIEYLLAGGAAMGIRNFLQRRKKSKNR
jgi:hypothetical protein